MKLKLIMTLWCTASIVAPEMNEMNELRHAAAATAVSFVSVVSAAIGAPTLIPAATAVAAGSCTALVTGFIISYCSRWQLHDTITGDDQNAEF